MCSRCKFLPALLSVIVSESVTGTQNPVGGGGGPSDPFGDTPPTPNFDPIQVPDSGSGGY